MLRLRICPNCQEEIRSPKVYFCHRCGAELPAPPEVTEETKTESVETRLIASLPKEQTKTRKLKIVAAVLCAALFSAAAVGVYYFYSQNQSSLTSQPQTPKNEAFVGDLSFAVQNHTFSAKGLSEIVPADVDLYLESIDPEVLLPSLILAEDWSKLESFFSEQIGLSTTEAASFLEDEFAVVQESTASAFLARVRDVDFVEQKIAEVGSYEEWRARIVEGVLVISDSPDLIRLIEEAQKKLTLNLSLTSGFVEARQKLPQTGQIFVYGKKRPEFISDSLKGEAFVISKKNGGSLITGL